MLQNGKIIFILLVFQVDLRKFKLSD